MKRLQVIHAGLTLLLLAAGLTLGVLTLTGVIEIRSPTRARTNERRPGADLDKAAQTTDPGARQPTVRLAPRVTAAGASGLAPAPGAMVPQFTFLQWPEGLTVLVVEQGWARTSRSGDFYSQSGSVWDAAGDQRYEWRLETADGQTGRYRIVPGKEYDLSKGSLFVIKAYGVKVEVHQLSRQLATVPLDGTKIEEYLKSDAEVRRILGAGNGL